MSSTWSTMRSQVPPGMPIASIFEHVGDDVWRTADGRDLLITPKTGAVLSCI